MSKRRRRRSRDSCARRGSKMVRSLSHAIGRPAMPQSGVSQSLLVKHCEDTKFEAMEANNGAPRPQFVYRRLGVEEATGGAYDAHVIKRSEEHTSELQSRV